MTDFAVIDANGVVENIIVASPGFELDGKQIVPVDEGAAIGGTYADGVFTPPYRPEQPEPVPDRVSARRFKMQMLEPIEPGFPDGIIDYVEAWVSAQPRRVKVAYENSQEFVRSEPMMASGFAALGFSEQQIDEFFTAAAAI